MRVLWFTNVPSPAVCKTLGGHSSRSGSGSWLWALESRLLQYHEDIHLGIASPIYQDEYIISIDSSPAYFGIPKNPPGLPIRHYGTEESAIYVNKMLNIIELWRPDIVHIHGTERCHGLIRKYLPNDIQTVVSIQGMLGHCNRVHFGNLNFSEILNSMLVKEALLGRGILWEYLYNLRRAVHEREIIRLNSNFIGRTLIDKRYVKSINRSCKYWKCNEIMRKEFYEHIWTVSGSNADTIICVNARNPLRGVETIIAAMRKLNETGIRVRLVLLGRLLSANSGYSRYLNRLIRRSDLRNQIETPGHLTACRMIEYLLSSRIFIIASYMENSSNSLSEAQLLGMPCIASNSGGNPSLVRNGFSGLLFEPGDVLELATAIKKLLWNPQFAEELGKNARRTALRRHNPRCSAETMYNIYRQLINI